MIYLDLMLSFMQIGLFSIGGGYAAIPLIQEQVVNIHKWMTISEFTNLITISEMTPGPIAINCATFVGIKVSGFLGSIVATFSVIIPSLIIVSILAFVYNKYGKGQSMKTVLSCIRPAVVALIAGAFLSILQLVVFGHAPIRFENVKIIGVVLFLFAFYFIAKKKKNPIFTMFLCGILYLIVDLIINP